MPGPGGFHPKKFGGPMKHGGGDDMKTKSVEVPRHAMPAYASSDGKSVAEAPPGHRFLLYFPGCSEKWELEYSKSDRDKVDKAENQGDWKTLEPYRKHRDDGWRPVKNAKRQAVNTASGMGWDAGAILEGITMRQTTLAGDRVWHTEAMTTSPIASGLGNPHPVENGFSFMSPYGVPYLSGSSIKGVIRRAAEELALFDEASGWTIPLVWALFGFDATSAYINDPGKNLPQAIRDETERWRNAYDTWVASSADKDVVLPLWLKIIENQLPKIEAVEKTGGWSPSVFCGSLSRNQDLRRSIHWQGLLSFWDAFPDRSARMAVDILNPHHKNYYEGKNAASTPNDAENPVPVFFLTLAHGAKFRFFVECHTRNGILHDGQWQDILKSAFEHSFEWLGFGAKTAVGYGAMRVDENAAIRHTQERDALEAARQIEEENCQKEEEARARQKAEEARLAALSPLERSMEEVLKNDPDKSKKPYIKLLEALKAGKWTGEDGRVVANKIRDMMKQEGEWIENPAPEKAKKDKGVKRTLEVMKYLIA